MKKWNLLDTAHTPDGEELKLFEQDGTYVIRLRGVDLMSTRQKASEEKLAEVGCVGLQTKQAASVLVGGLGFGFTLRAVLAHVAQDAKVTVAELIPAIVQWNKNSAYPLSADALQDPRVELLIQDVGKVLQISEKCFDAILLDVDNGPSALTMSDNRYLYGDAGVQRLRKALRAGGRACIWSIDDSPPFEKLLSKNGFSVECVRTRAHDTSGGMRTIFVAKLSS